MCAGCGQREGRRDLRRRLSGPAGRRLADELHRDRHGCGIALLPTGSDPLQRALDGDSAAYSELVRTHQDIAFRAAYLVTGSAAEAEDAAQDGFVKAWQSLPRFRRDAPFRPWLLAIVTNEARNRRRHAGRQAALALRAFDPPGAGTEEAAAAHAEHERLLRIVGGLSEEHRLVIGYRYFLDLSEDETAEALAIPRGTVKSRLARALERLREQMEAER
jgi:RNA polymerase sigma factor (sigma-70 family)